MTLMCSDLKTFSIRTMLGIYRVVKIHQNHYVDHIRLFSEASLLFQSNLSKKKKNRKKKEDMIKNLSQSHSCFRIIL